MVARTVATMRRSTSHGDDGGDGGDDGGDGGGAGASTKVHSVVGTVTSSTVMPPRASPRSEAGVLASSVILCRTSSTSTSGVVTVATTRTEAAVTETCTDASDTLSCAARLIRKAVALKSATVPATVKDCVVV